jgi:hypothetical protein
MAAADGKQLPRDNNPAIGNGTTPDTLVDVILRDTQYSYAIVLLASFIGCVSWYSVYNAKKEEDVVQSHVKGPGGKPLPITKKKKRDDGARKLGPHFGQTAKNVFRYLAAVVFLSYAATGSLMFVHAFWHEDPFRWAREGLPWAGEGTMVCKCVILNSFLTPGKNIYSEFYELLHFVSSVPLLTQNRSTFSVQPFSTYTLSFPSSTGVRDRMLSIS